jgi:hypothetical protein
MLIFYLLYVFFGMAGWEISLCLLVILWSLA